MTTPIKYQLLTCFIALIWFINGFICKVLNLVPRHQEIVANILGKEHAQLLTISIGFAEVAMAVWILSGFKPRTNALIQMIVIAAMNTLEFFLVPDLLLWGKANACFAFLLIFMIYYNEFHIKQKLALQL